MRYTFETSELGRCELERRTSGKNGFGLHKVFVLTAPEAANVGSLTVTYTNNLVMGVGHIDPTDETLSRIAIAQFLRNGESPRNNVENLNLDVCPFHGEVRGSSGARLRPAALVRTVSKYFI